MSKIGHEPRVNTKFAAVGAKFAAVGAEFAELQYFLELSRTGVVALRRHDAKSHRTPLWGEW